MTSIEIRKTLEKQLQLLSERSKEAVDASELEALSNAMVEVTTVLQNPCGFFADAKTLARGVCGYIQELQERQVITAPPEETFRKVIRRSTAYDFVKGVHETTSMGTVEELLATNDWVVIAIARGENNVYLFSLGRIR